MAVGLRQQRVATRRQAILEYFAEVERPFGDGVKGPSVREIQVHLVAIGFAEVSLGNLNADLHRLRKDGCLLHLRDDADPDQVRDDGSESGRRLHRPYRLTDKGRTQARSTAHPDGDAALPPASEDEPLDDDPEPAPSSPAGHHDPLLLGEIAAGTPINPGALAADTTTLLGMLGCDLQDVVMKVRGSSMQDAGIHDGDYVIVRAQPPDRLSRRDIVVVVTASEPAEMALKWVERFDEGLVLHPVNAVGLDWRLEPHGHDWWDPDDISIQGVLRWTICGHRARPTARDAILGTAP